MQRIAPMTRILASVLACGTLTSWAAAQETFFRVKVWGNGWTVPEGITHLKDVSTGTDSMVGILPDGSLTWWTQEGTLEIETDPNQNGLHVFADEPNRKEFVSVHSGYDHGVALRADGTFLAWYYKNETQACLGKAGVLALPLQSTMKTVACGEGITAVIEGTPQQTWGTLHIYGYDYGCYPSQAPQPPSDRYTRVESTGHFFLAERTDGTFLKFGPFPENGTVGQGCCHYSCIFSKAGGVIVDREDIAPGVPIQAFTTGHTFMLFLDNSGMILDRSGLAGQFNTCPMPVLYPEGAGCNQRAQLGNSRSQTAQEYLPGGSTGHPGSPTSGIGSRFLFTKIAGGYRHATGLVLSDTDGVYPPGSLVAWGEREQGQHNVPTTGYGFVTFSSNYDSGAALARCYANCDDSTATPILSANDFQCFLNLYSSGSQGANCDESTAPPVLNVNDFICFMNKYAEGCT